MAVQAVGGGEPKNMEVDIQPGDAKLSEYWREFVDTDIDYLEVLVEDYNKTKSSKNIDELSLSEQAIGSYFFRLMRVAETEEQRNRIQSFLNKMDNAESEEIVEDFSVEQIEQTFKPGAEWVLSDKPSENDKQIFAYKQAEGEKHSTKIDYRVSGKNTEYKIISSFEDNSDHPEEIKVECEIKGKKIFLEFLATDFIEAMKPKEITGIENEETLLEIKQKYIDWVGEKVNKLMKEREDKEYEDLQNKKPIIREDYVGNTVPYMKKYGQLDSEEVRKHLARTSTENSPLKPDKSEDLTKKLAPPEIKLEDENLAPEFIQENIEKSFDVGGEWVLGEGAKKTETLAVDEGGIDGVLGGSIPGEITLRADHIYKIVKTFGIDGLDPDEVGIADESANDNKVYMMPVRNLFNNLRPKWILDYTEGRRGFIKAQYHIWLDAKFSNTMRTGDILPPTIEPPEQPEDAGQKGGEATAEEVSSEKFQDGKLRIENEIIKNFDANGKEITEKEIIILEPGVKRKWDYNSSEVILTIKNIREVSKTDELYEIEFEEYGRSFTRTYEQWCSRYYDSKEVI